MSIVVPLLIHELPNGNKGKRDKEFCFDVRLEPNPRSLETTRIHGVGCNSEELHGIRETSDDMFIQGPGLPIVK